MPVVTFVVSTTNLIHNIAGKLEASPYFEDDGT